MIRAHSTLGYGWRPSLRIGKLLLLASLAATALAAATPAAAVPAGAAPSSAHWMQIESRIESEYFRQSVAGLQALAVALSDPPAAGAPQGRDGQWRSYYGALLAYRLALLSKGDAARAWPFTARCVDRLDRVLAMDPGSAEALALQSACLALQSRLDPWRSPFAAPLSVARMNKALRLAPGDPRVLLLAALAADDLPRLFGGDAQRAFALMRRAVSAFEAQGGGPRTLPGWGAAEAFTDLAQDYLLRGRTIAARDVLERALLVAPDFAQARELMAEIVSG